MLLYKSYRLCSYIHKSQLFTYLVPLREAGQKEYEKVH
jgi:hypothetical protein